MSKLLKDQRIYVIFGITLIAVMGVASLSPAFPKIAKTLNLSETKVGLLISVFTLPGVFLAPIAGILADRIGRKNVLIPSLFLFSLSGFACFFTKDFKILLLFRFFQGVGAASLGSLNVTLIGDFFKGKDRPAVMGYNASALSLFTASYPLIGGFLAAIGWFYPFLLPLLAIPVGLAVIFGIKEPEIDKNPDFLKYLKEASKSIIRKEVVALFILSILTFIILYGAFLTYIPFLLNQNFNLNSKQIGIFISLSSVATAITATQTGKLTNKYGGSNLLKIAFGTYMLVMIIIPFVNNLYFFLIPILFFGFAQALNIPSLQTLLTDFAPDDKRAVFMSTNGMVLRIGQTIGPLVIGIGYSIAKIPGVYFLGASFAFIGLIVILTIIKKKKK